MSERNDERTRRPPARGLPRRGADFGGAAWLLRDSRAAAETERERKGGGGELAEPEPRERDCAARRRKEKENCGQTAFWARVQSHSNFFRLFQKHRERKKRLPVVLSPSLHRFLSARKETQVRHFIPSLSAHAALEKSAGKTERPREASSVVDEKDKKCHAPWPVFALP